MTEPDASPAWQHGYSGYVNRGCHCETCRKGNADYHRAYRAARAAAEKAGAEEARE